MIGIYGVFGRTGALATEERLRAGRRMCDGLEGSGFIVEEADDGEDFIALARRAGHPNLDLALRRRSGGLIGALAGYAMFSGEGRMQWASGILDELLARYRERGLEAAERLEGCFFLCLKDGDSLVFLTDRFGAKVQYYADLHEAVVIAPDVRRIMDSGLVPARRDMEGVKQVLGAGFFLGDRTLVSGVRRIPSGTFLTKRLGAPWETRSRRYWQVPCREGTDGGSVDESAGEMGGRLEAAIDRLESLESRIAVPLSGGLDSRCIASFLAARRPIAAITYDSGSEVAIARRVSAALKADHTVFSNRNLAESDFGESLSRLGEAQRVHAVVNQYFYSPLFRNYFAAHPEALGIYDGIYLDALFNTAYTVPVFGPSECLKVYGAAARGTLARYTVPDREEWERTIRDACEEACSPWPDADGVGRSQLMYLTGRLRRYVNESGADRENYGYVLRPGFDYELCDFGYRLRLAARKGSVYSAMQRKRFPRIMAIPFRDPRGRRTPALKDRVRTGYHDFRAGLSAKTGSRIPFCPYQADWFFYRKRHLEDYRRLFFERSYIEEIMTPAQLRTLYADARRKQYLLPLFQRVQFIQQFYRSSGF